MEERAFQTDYGITGVNFACTLARGGMTIPQKDAVDLVLSTPIYHVDAQVGVFYDELNKLTKANKWAKQVPNGR
jgi:hypothetical protein